MWKSALHWSLGLALLLSLAPGIHGQELPLRGLPDSRPHFAPVDDRLVLKIDSPDGTCYVRIYGQIDGPVRIPLPDESGLKALQLATEMHQGGRVTVALSAVESELFITPVGSYELSGKHIEALHLPELSAFGLADWSMSLGRPPEVASDCCLCGRLGCCPKAGKCLTCGDCGDCCLVK